MRCGMWGCETDIKGDFQGVGGCTFYSYRGDRERHIWRNKVKLCFSRVKLEMRIRFLNIVFSWCQSCRYVCECVHMNVKKWDWVKRALDRMSRCLVWGVGKRKKIKQKPMWLWACNLIFFLLLLLSRFSCVRLCATPLTAAHQAPLSLGFSRQEHWSGLPFPSPMHESGKWKWSRSVVSDSYRPHGLQPTRLPRPWDFPGKSTGVGCHCLGLILSLKWKIH